MRGDVPGLLSAYAAGGHERSPVGWWCALLSLVLYCFTWLCAATVNLCDGEALCHGRVLCCLF
jgi:hypothetical protein